jgi:hypothetical protein
MISKIAELKLIAYQLTRPVSYLRIQHDDKWIYDWLVPGALTAFSCLALFFMTPLAFVTGGDGLLSQLTGFLENLPGFFIAALAAVATFNRHDIDEVMNNPPRVRIMYQGNIGFIEMTRRRFLCVLFSYLTAISIFLIIAYYLAAAISKGTDIPDPLGWSFCAVYLFLFWQMVTATLLGLYYLGERLHTPDA